MKENFYLKEDIPVFTDKEQYWGEVDENKMRKYLELIEEKGFSYFKKNLLAEDRNFYNFIFDETRADWRFCLPTEKNWKALDAGAGLGANAFVLAKEIKHVFAMERSFLRAKFLNLRKNEENQSNIDVIVADSLNLPFEDESFDLIAANGLFEWLGMTDKFKLPKDAQGHFLKEAARVLKKNGYLYIGIENRFAASYLLGGLDHSGLRYTSWMPRFMANLYAKIRTSKKYQTYTYSKFGYEKILKQAGFKNIEFYLPFPGYNIPKYIVSYNHLDGLKFLVAKVLGGLNFRKKILKKIIYFPFLARLWRIMFFSFDIFAQKP